MADLDVLLAQRGIGPNLLCASGGGYENDTTLSIASSRNTFGGRRLFPLGRYSPEIIVPCWHPFSQTGFQSTPENAAPNAVPITKAAMVLYSSALTPLSSPVPITFEGARSFNIPTGVAEWFPDPLFPADFGYSQLPGNSLMEVRQLTTLSAGQVMPTASQTLRPGAGQSYRGTAAQLGDFVDAVGSWPMQAAGADELSIFFPSMLLGAFSIPITSWLFNMDSIGARQNDFPGLGYLNGRGGFQKVAGFLEGVPHHTYAIGGKTMRQALRGRTAQIAKRFTDVFFNFISNDTFYSLFGGAAGQPVTVDTLLSDNRELTALYKAAGPKRVYCGTGFPRCVTNNFVNTDLTNQAPAVSQATVAGVASRDGYGYGPGETMEQYNAAILAAAATTGYPDAVINIGALGADATTPSKWKVPGKSGTILGALPTAFAATVSIASPAVITKTAHTLAVGQPVSFSTTGALPTGIPTIQRTSAMESPDIYYVVSVPTADTFTVSLTPGGTAINTTGSQSGTHTVTCIGALLDTAVSVGDSIAFEPGMTNVDVSGTSGITGQGGPHVQAVFGSASPFIAVFQKTDPLGGPRGGAVTAKGHAIGSAWSLTNTTDGIHPGQPIHMLAEPLMRLAIRRSTRLTIA